jgi:lysophospholipase L1-like esterase
MIINQTIVLIKLKYHRMKKNLLVLVICLFCIGQNLQAKDEVIKIVVLGSSTAAGSGPANSANAWVNQYRQYIKAINASSEVINLAVGGYTTYHVLPSDFTPPTDRPSPDTDHNITKALSLNPDVIIINLPSNDAASNYTVVEELNNYKLILEKAAVRNVPVFITTTQPRNFSFEQRQNLIAVCDSTIKRQGTKSIDFWTGIATAGGTINPIYDSGDGVHLNDAAHTVLKNRVVSSNILTYSRSDNEKDTINIDFGSTLSTGAWNNLDSP